MKAKGNITDGVDARGGMRRDKSSFLNSLSIYFLHSSVGGCKFQIRPFKKSTITLCKREDCVSGFKWQWKLTVTSKCHFSDCHGI